MTMHQNLSKPFIMSVFPKVQEQTLPYSRFWPLIKMLVQMGRLNTASNLDVGKGSSESIHILVLCTPKNPLLEVLNMTYLFELWIKVLLKEVQLLVCLFKLFLFRHHHLIHLKLKRLINKFRSQRVTKQNTW